jgi:hypothetical protein
MRVNKRMISDANARLDERGPKAVALALDQILKLRDSGVMNAVTLRLPSDKWMATRLFFEMSEAMLDACGHLNDNTEEHYELPGESELAGQAQREEVERLQAILAKVGVRSRILVGRIVEFISGQAITHYAITKRLANKEAKGHFHCPVPQPGQFLS